MLPASRSRVLTASIVLVVALAVRMAYFASTIGTELMNWYLFDQTDCHMYLEWADRVRAGDWLDRDAPLPPPTPWMLVSGDAGWWRSMIGEHTYFVPPLYPYFLAVALGSFNQVSFPLALQLMIGALGALWTCCLGWRLGELRTGAWIGLLAGLAVAVHGPLLVNEGMLLRDGVTIAAITGSLLLVVRALERPAAARRWLLAGVAAGVTMLLKESALFALGLGALAGLLLSGTPRERARRVTLVLAGALLALSPLFARNALVGAQIFRLSPAGTFHLATSWAADSPTRGVGVSAARSVRGIVDQSHGQLLPAMKLVLATHPNARSVFAFAARKWFYIFSTSEVADDISPNYVRRVIPWFRFTGRFAWLLPTGLAGMVAAIAALALPRVRTALGVDEARARCLRLVTAWLAATVSLLSLSHVESRWRLLIVVPFALLGAWVLCVALASARARRYARAAILLVLIGGGIAAVPHLAGELGQWRMLEHYTGADIMWRLGDAGRAQRIFAAGAATAPDDATRDRMLMHRAAMQVAMDPSRVTEILANSGLPALPPEAGPGFLATAEQLRPRFASAKTR